MQLRTKRPFLIALINLILLLSVVTYVAADNDVRAVKKSQHNDTFKRLSSDKPHLFNQIDAGCVLPGEVIHLKGDNLSGLNNYHLVLRTKRQFVALKQLSISKQQILVQIPRDTALKRGQRYSLLLLGSEGVNVSKKTGISLKLCPTINKRRLLTVREAHEDGEILILASSGITDQIIKEGTKLGYLLLRRYQLNSLNQTLMVLGGSDKKLTRAISNLRATFTDAKIDFNHHYFTSQQPALVNATHQVQWPARSTCLPNNANPVTIGLLDGGIDLAHPALAAKTIKTHNFLLPAQTADNQHATAIAIFLVGNQSQQEVEGLVPFVSLKAAGVVRKDAGIGIATAESLTRALDWFIKEQVQLVNVSLTSPHANTVTDSLFAESIKQGLIIFSAAGNNSQKLHASYPAALPDVIAISAVDVEGKVLASANQGDYIDFAAPAVDSRTTSGKLHGNYSSVTSFAVPHAISIAALYLNQQASLSRDRLFESMQHNAVDLGNQGYDNRYGWGQLQVSQKMCHH
ncbi:S8 family serine peptidase [Methylophaga thiooxydans]|uniref:S8 family serine peptidase n=1 Tax=Methylophaga thiooxydans TaxID=392484 RepID=UPI0023548C4F|nr:S8 family serine peptidase [Methylophaga thiooxydans]